MDRTFVTQIFWKILLWKSRLPSFSPPLLNRRRARWVVGGIIALWTVAVFYFAYKKYYTLNSEWAFDLGYFNQWFWQTSHGEAFITIQPRGNFTQEGPTIWRTNHLQPIRFLLVPSYLLHRGPGILLFIQALGIGVGAVAVVSIIGTRTRRASAGVFGACMYLTLPFVLEFCLNDFRLLHWMLPGGLAAYYFLRTGRYRCFYVACTTLMLVREEGMLLVVLLMVHGLVRGWWLRRTRAFSPQETRALLVAGLKTMILVAGYAAAFMCYKRLVLRVLGNWYLIPSISMVTAHIGNAANQLWKYYGLWLLIPLLMPGIYVFGWPLLLILIGNRSLNLAGHYQHYVAIFSVFLVASLAELWGRFGAALSLRANARRSSALMLIITVAVAFLGTSRIIKVTAQHRETPDVIAVHDMHAEAGDAAVMVPYSLAAVFSGRSSCFIYEQLPRGMTRLHALATSQFLVVKRNEDIAEWPMTGFRLFRTTDNFLFYRR